MVFREFANGCKEVWLRRKFPTTSSRIITTISPLLFLSWLFQQGLSVSAGKCPSKMIEYSKKTKNLRHYRETSKKNQGSTSNISHLKLEMNHYRTYTCTLIKKI